MFHSYIGINNIFFTLKNKFLLVLFILAHNISYSQNKIDQKRNIDSLLIISGSKDFWAIEGNKELLRLCTEIYYQSKEIDYLKGMMTATSKMSNIYMNEGNYQMALKKISEGKILAQKSQDYGALSHFLMNEGRIHSELGYTKKSRKVLKEGLSLVNKLSVEEQLVVKFIVYKTMSSNVKKENESNNSDSVIIYLEKGLSESKKLPNNYLYKKAYLSAFALDLGTEYYARNKLPESEKYLLEFTNYMENEKDKSDFIYYNLLRGNIENKKKHYVQAIEYFDKSIQIVQQYKVYTIALKEIYSGKAESYLGLQDYKNQAIYATKAKKITDSLSQIEKEVLNNEMPVKAQEISDKGDGSDYFNRDNYVLFAIFSVIMGGCVIYFLFIKKRSEDLDYTEEKTISSVNMEILEQNEILNQKENHDATNDDIKELIELAQGNDRSFHLRFSEIFPMFNQQLLAINPQLTHTDLEYCALIKLKFDTKEIAQYKNLSVNSVVSKKYRIRKKLNINTSENIYTWMFKIGKSKSESK